MKTACVLSLVLLSASVAAARDPATRKANLPPVQAPPGMNDPGVKEKPPSEQSASPAAAEKPPAKAASTDTDSHKLPADVQAAAEAAELPVITVRQRGSDTIEEYRKHGKLVFVRVLSKNGPPKYYVDNPGNIPPNMMKRLSGPSGNVQPVYYKLYEWQ